MSLSACVRAYVRAWVCPCMRMSVIFFNIVIILQLNLEGLVLVNKQVFIDLQICKVKVCQSLKSNFDFEVKVCICTSKLKFNCEVLGFEWKFDL